MQDFKLEDHGSIWLVRPLSDAATAWLVENTNGTWWGGALAVEPRFVSDLVDGMASDGFAPEPQTS
jgi:hypothetical protein